MVGMLIKSTISANNFIMYLTIMFAPFILMDLTEDGVRLLGRSSDVLDNLFEFLRHRNLLLAEWTIVRVCLVYGKFFKTFHTNLIKAWKD
jgi:hypothetical protein